MWLLGEKFSHGVKEWTVLVTSQSPKCALQSEQANFQARDLGILDVFLSHLAFFVPCLTFQTRLAGLAPLRELGGGEGISNPGFCFHFCVAR
jgi:hypothetical protein